MLESILQSENGHTRHVFALNYILNRHTEYMRQIIYYVLYEKSTIRLASVGLAQAHPNYCSVLEIIFFHTLSMQILLWRM